MAARRVAHPSRLALAGVRSGRSSRPDANRACPAVPADDAEALGAVPMRPPVEPSICGARTPLPIQITRCIEAACVASGALRRRTLAHQRERIPLALDRLEQGSGDASVHVPDDACVNAELARLLERGTRVGRAAHLNEEAHPPEEGLGKR